MHLPFEDTLSSLNRQPGLLSGRFLSAALVFTAAWLYAALYFEIPVSVESTAARLVAAEQPMDLKAPRPLPVLSVQVGLGSEVQAGDLLVELDTGHWRAVRQAAEEEIASLELARDAVSREIGELMSEAQSRRAGARARKKVVGAEMEALDAEIDRVAAELGRLESMSDGGAISDSELMAARTTLATRQAERRALEARSQQLDAVAQRDEASMRRHRAGLERQVALMDERRAEKRGEARQALALEQQGQIVAPTTGRIGAMANLAPGTVVDTAEWLLTLVPATQVAVEASFDSSSIGQLAEGQLGWLRVSNGQRGLLQGLPLRLEQVANEPRQGLASAKFSVVANPDQVALAHGLEGELVVRVRQASAAVLLLEALERRRPDWL